jgi:membrane-associated phospholipid phosphatase
MSLSDSENNGMSRSQSSDMFRWLGSLALGIVILGILVTGKLNQSVFLFFNGWSRLTGPAIWEQITILGDTLVAMMFLAFFIRKRPDLLAAVLYGALIGVLLTQGLKHLVNAARPPAVLPSDAITVIGPALKRNSFPSGHTATLFTLMGCFSWIAVKKWIRIPLLLTALLASVSRMVVGVHWPLDVAAGCLTGLLASAGGILFTEKTSWWKHAAFRAIFGMLFLASALYLTFGYDIHYQAYWLKTGIGLTALVVSGVEYYRLMGDIWRTRTKRI